LPRRPAGSSSSHGALHVGDPARPVGPASRATRLAPPVAVEALRQRHDLEACVRCSGTRIDTTQIYTRIRPPHLKRPVVSYETSAQRMPNGETKGMRRTSTVRRRMHHLLEG
jgi:hypothetical protein